MLYLAWHGDVLGNIYRARRSVVVLWHHSDASLALHCHEFSSSMLRYDDAVAPRRAVFKKQACCRTSHCSHHHISRRRPHNIRAWLVEGLCVNYAFLACWIVFVCLDKHIPNSGTSSTLGMDDTVWESLCINHLMSAMAEREKKKDEGSGRHLLHHSSTMTTSPLTATALHAAVRAARKLTCDPEVWRYNRHIVQKHVGDKLRRSYLYKILPWWMRNPEFFLGGTTLVFVLLVSLATIDDVLLDNSVFGFEKKELLGAEREPYFFGHLSFFFVLCFSSAEGVRRHSNVSRYSISTPLMGWLIVMNLIFCGAALYTYFLFSSGILHAVITFLPAWLFSVKLLWTLWASRLAALTSKASMDAGSAGQKNTERRPGKHSSRKTKRRNKNKRKKPRVILPNEENLALKVASVASQTPTRKIALALAVSTFLAIAFGVDIHYFANGDEKVSYLGWAIVMFMLTAVGDLLLIYSSPSLFFTSMGMLLASALIATMSLGVHFAVKCTTAYVDRLKGEWWLPAIVSVSYPVPFIALLIGRKLYLRSGHFDTYSRLGMCVAGLLCLALVAILFRADFKEVATGVLIALLTLAFSSALVIQMWYYNTVLPRNALSRHAFALLILIVSWGCFGVDR